MKARAKTATNLFLLSRLVLASAQIKVRKQLMRGESYWRTRATTTHLVLISKIKKASILIITQKWRIRFAKVLATKNGLKLCSGLKWCILNTRTSMRRSYILRSNSWQKMDGLRKADKELKFHLFQRHLPRHRKKKRRRRRSSRLNQTLCFLARCHLTLRRERSIRIQTARSRHPNQVRSRKLKILVVRKLFASGSKP